MSRLPIRVRVAAGFAVAMALVLAGTGLFLYVRLGDDLTRSLDQDLRLRAQDLSALVTESGGSLAAQSDSGLIERGESFAQLLDGRGDVLDATRSLGTRPLLTTPELSELQGARRFFDRPSVPGLDEPARLLAVPLQRGAQRLVLVVGATLENRAEALRGLRTELLIALPAALLLATLLGYWLAGSGLRAVEAMRRRAAEISAERAHERLPLPRAPDELRELGETLNAMLDRLEHALDRQRAFVAEAGHELRTPLALLRAELDYGLHYAQNPDELRAALQTAGREADRLGQLASDLLLLASTEHGELPLRIEQLAVDDVLESVRERFAWRSQVEGRQVVLEAAPDLMLDADRLRIEQALANLVENALRHGAGTVTITAVHVNGAIELHVHDEGSGFPPDFLDRAFERFSRPEESRSTGGSGLGLTIVQTIARAHGGQTRAANAPRGGADVAIRLPAGVARAATRSESSSAV
ncbi:MAG TPA: ATP-binding protein [Solirubrobacteraceae bacterium]|nr:ATP-binding protein [Solirubrobacteraceae bacterium]